jgi:hypothetical protein
MFLKVKIDFDRLHNSSCGAFLKVDFVLLAVWWKNPIRIPMRGFPTSLLAAGQPNQNQRKYLQVSKGATTEYT